MMLILGYSLFALGIILVLVFWMFIYVIKKPLLYQQRELLDGRIEYTWQRAYELSALDWIFRIFGVAITLAGIILVMAGGHTWPAGFAILLGGSVGFFLLIKLAEILAKRWIPNESSQPSRQECICERCRKNIPSVREEMVDNGMIYCSECTIAEGLIKQYRNFEVFLYTFPWNAAIRAYAYHGLGWLPTYQAETGLPYELDRTVSKTVIPRNAMYAHITLAISQHGSFTYYAGVPAFIAFREDIRLFFAYVPEEIYRSTYRVM